MPSLTQIVPYEIDQDRRTAKIRYDKDYAEHISLLQESYNGLLLKIFPPEIHSPYPIGVTLNSFYIMKKVTDVISRAIKVIVHNYFKDPRLCNSMLQVCEDAKVLLKIAEKNQYEIGSWRPDILYPQNDLDRFQICEINARFPFNAFYVSHEKNNILGRLSYLKGMPLMPISELDGIPKVFSEFFDCHKNVGVIKCDHCEGWDVKMFKGGLSHEVVSNLTSKKRPREEKRECPDIPEMSRSDSASFPHPPVTATEISQALSLNDAESLAKAKASARFVHPNDLGIDELSGNTDCKLFDSIGPLDQFAIECSTNELLQVDTKIIEHLTSSKHFNDLRTIFLAHDKRMLAVLTSSIIKDYLKPHDVELLQSFIVPTFIVGVHSEAVSQAKRNRNDWVLKPNSGGKGKGIVFGRDCSPEMWNNLLDDPCHQSFVLQQVVSQQHVDIYTSNGPKKMLVVGLLHCFNSDFLGPGIFRASNLTNPIVNVSGGNGIILSPAILSCRWNLKRRVSSTNCSPNTSNLLFDFPPSLIHTLSKDYPLSKFKSGMCTSIQESLQQPFERIWNVLDKEGIAVVNTNWMEELPKDYSNNDLQNIDSALLEFVHLLDCEPHAHSSTVGSIWDVRPLHQTVSVECNDRDGRVNANACKPRSQTAEEFNMHTDCSFESPPPRYLLLFVVHEDRCGGGYSTLMDTEVLMRYLSRESLYCLLNTSYELKVPKEFFKGKATLKTHLISKSEKLFRYRSDIIVRESCSQAQLEALDELDRLLNSPSLVLTTLIPTGSILLLDNSRWFHGRSAVLDKDRWLKRIRFNASPARMSDIPPLQRLVSRSKSIEEKHKEFRERDDSLDSLSSSLDGATKKLKTSTAGTK